MPGEILSGRAGNAAAERDVYSVSRLNREVGRLLQTRLPVLWVEGELSNMARPGSGHWYFSLKDPAAQVRCAMFRSRNRLLAFQPSDGDQVLVRGRVGVYEPRGEYQFVVDHMEPAGEGALRLAFERLKKRLDAEGLFSAEEKLELPRLPRCIGVITSPTGAALRDILKVLRRRMPAVPVIVYPVPVQGEGAAGRIADALRLAARRAECDVLILARGGGSLEDLWAFNEEALARAIFACPLPVVCGVGHEVDISIADLVADLRAPTPSAAAELAVPDQAQWLRNLEKLDGRLAAATRRRLERASERLAQVSRRLGLLHPARELTQFGQRVDELEQRLFASIQGGLRRRRASLSAQAAHLLRLSPSHRLATLALRSNGLAQRLGAAMRRTLDTMSSRLAVSGGKLDAVSPLATLARGYAIIRRGEDNEIVRSARQVHPDEVIEAMLARGRLRARVVERSEDDSR